MQILRTSTNPLYLDITWTTLELFSGAFLFNQFGQSFNSPLKQYFQHTPTKQKIYTTSSPKTPFAFLPRSPIASHLPPTMWALFLHSFHPLPLYLAVLHFISFLYLSHLLSCTMTKRRVQSSRVGDGPKNNIKNGQNCPQPQKGFKCYFCSFQYC